MGWTTQAIDGCHNDFACGKSVTQLPAKEADQATLDRFMQRPSLAVASGSGGRASASGSAKHIPAVASGKALVVHSCKVNTGKVEPKVLHAQAFKACQIICKFSVVKVVTRMVLCKEA